MTRPYATHPTPARVSAQAARPFPSAVLWILCVVYIFAGLFGRAPWPQDDAAGFGLMTHMAEALAQGNAALWWLPTVAGMYITDEGPLAFWVGALFQHVLGASVGPVAATRLACVLWFTLTVLGVWHTMRRLARREEAQPIAFVFGGEASNHAYGRMLADMATLLFIGTVGIALRIHETSAEPAALALAAAGFYGLVLTLDRPLAGALVAGASFGLWMLTRGASHAPFMALAYIGAFALMPLARSTRTGVIIAFVLLASLMVSLWPLGAYTYAPAQATNYFNLWQDNFKASLTWPTQEGLGWLLRNTLWYTWPLWPLALWTLYSWRHALRAWHLLLPLCLTGGALSAAVFSQTPTDAVLMLLLPPLSILAAFGAPTLRRGADNSIDWMSIALFSLLALVTWAYFIAMQTGTPPKMAASVARLTQGFHAQLEPAAIALAIAATSAWLALIGWRLRRRPEVLWRGPLLAASGLVMLWSVLASLFMPAIDHNRHYAQLAERIAQAAQSLGGPNVCFMPHRLSPAHLALFAHYGKLRFAQIHRGEVCSLALHRDSARTLLDDDPPPGQWQAMWEGGWPARPDETFRIYRRMVP
ncbi:MAG TPA: hypothetical protein PLQ67_04670 [Burkholderiaceae bacterium]|nr:hypothetical protein [Burkholderiaceae bacterium]